MRTGADRLMPFDSALPINFVEWLGGNDVGFERRRGVEGHADEGQVRHASKLALESRSRRWDSTEIEVPTEWQDTNDGSTAAGESRNAARCPTNLAEAAQTSRARIKPGRQRFEHRSQEFFAAKEAAQYVMERISTW